MATESLLVRMSMDARQYNREARRAATSTGAVAGSAQAAGRATGGLGSKMKNLAASGGGLLAVTGGAVAVKQAFDGTVGAFANFDDAMTQSLAIMGDVSDEMSDDMSDAAREVAKVTTFSAEQAAESYFFLASAGLDAEQSIAALPQVAQFAQAGMFDLATATDLATDAQSVLGLASDNAKTNLENLTRVTDVLVNANSEANATVEQFATSLTQKAGGALRSVGKDIEEGIAVLSVFADQGIKGERGGTILRATLDGLTTNARDNAAAFEELGIAVFDSEDNMRNMADITADIEDALAGLPTRQREAALAQLGFNKRSREGILALEGNSEALREYEDSARSAGDATQEVADKQLESAKKQFELFMSQLADVGLELGEKVLPALMDLLPALQSTAEGMGDVVIALGPLIEGLGLISQGYTDIRLSAQYLKGRDDPFSRLAGGITDLMTQGALPGFLSILGEIQDEMSGVNDPAREAAEGFSVLGGEANQIPTAFEGIPPAMEDSQAAIHDLTPEMRALFGAAGDVAEAQEDVERETSDATTAMQAQFDLLRSQLDPMFALQDAASRAAEAEQALADADPGSEEERQAVQDLAEAMLDLRGAEVDVVEAGALTREEFVRQQVELGLTREHAELLADSLDDLESFQFTPKEISIRTRVSGPGSPSIGSFFGSANERHSGGPGRAGEPYRIRPDEEIFVPSGDGDFLLNNQVMDALQGLAGSGATTSTTENHYHTTIESSGDPNTDAQLVGAIESVRRRLETR